MQRVTHNVSGNEIKLVGVTGTNGKSTVCYLAKGMLEYAGLKTRLVENIESFESDEDLQSALSDNSIDVLLLEISAKALKDLDAKSNPLNLDVSALLNVTDDHFDWYNSPDEYALDKAKIYEGTKTACIFNVLDRFSNSYVQEAEVQEGARAIGFTSHTPARSQIGCVEGILTDRAFYKDDTDPLRFLQANELADLTNYPNLLSPQISNHPSVIPEYLVQNIAAATAIARSLGTDASAITKLLEAFAPPKSRNELVYTRKLGLEDGFSLGEIIYVDDTASVNPKSTTAVLATYPDNSVVLIAGGYAKGLEYDTFIRNIQSKLAAVIVFGGEYAPIYRTLREFAPNIPTYLVESDENAVKNALNKANELALSGQCVLFSPASNLKALVGDNVAEEYVEHLKNMQQIILEKAKAVGWDRFDI